MPCKKKLKKSNQRQSKRASIELQVTPVGHSRNLSSTGMFIATTKKYQIGDNVEFCFFLPNVDTKIRVETKVMWTSDELINPGVGVTFIRFISGSSQLITDYLESVKG